MLQHFRLIPFIIGLAMGIIGIYFVQPDKTVNIKYPTPDKASTAIYKDRNGICYKYEINKVNCDTNEGKMKNFPLSG
jgi:hypothetical protein